MSEIQFPEISSEELPIQGGPLKGAAGWGPTIQTAVVMPALDRQIGGGHYKDRAIQPIEYIHANGLPFIEGSVVKYITRWRDKGGVQDLEKIKHYVDLLIELERRKGKA